MINGCLRVYGYLPESRIKLNSLSMALQVTTELCFNISLDIRSCPGLLFDLRAIMHCFITETVNGLSVVGFSVNISLYWVIWFPILFLKFTLYLSLLPCDLKWSISWLKLCWISTLLLGLLSFLKEFKTSQYFFGSVYFQCRSLSKSSFLYWYFFLFAIFFVHGWWFYPGFFHH